jgi:hypothetical protein
VDLQPSTSKSVRLSVSKPEAQIADAGARTVGRILNACRMLELWK